MYSRTYGHIWQFISVCCLPRLCALLYFFFATFITFKLSEYVCLDVLDTLFCSFIFLILLLVHFLLELHLGCAVPLLLCTTDVDAFIIIFTLLKPSRGIARAK